MAKHSWEPDPSKHSFDVIVVGASLSGSACAAVLANKGLKVALVDHLDTVGGKHGATDYNGYWINWGHRDAINGIGDQLSVPLEELYEEAGIKVKVIEGGYGDSVRFHSLPEGGVAEITFDEMMGTDVARLGYDELEGYRRRVRIFGVPDDAVEDAANELKRVLEKLTSMSEDEAWSLVKLDLGEWMRRNVRSPYVRNVLISNLESFQSSPGEDASLGRFVLFALKLPPRGLGATGPMVDDNSTAAGEQASVTPFYRRFLELGGTSYLGWKPIEIVVDHPRGGATCKVSGVVCKNKSNFVEHLTAPVVITDYLGWDLGRLLDETLLPPLFRDRAADVKRYATDVVSWWAGLSRLPRIRSTGEMETFRGWNRMQYGFGAVKEYHGGWHFTSLQDPKVAPPGKHLVGMSMGHQDRFETWAQAKYDIDAAVAYMHNFYLDLEACVEWSHYQWVDPPQVQSWAFKPVMGHPVKISTIEGLYCASSSAETASMRLPYGGLWSLAEFAAALEATGLVMQEYGHLARAR